MCWTVSALATCIPSQSSWCIRTLKSASQPQWKCMAIAACYRGMDVWASVLNARSGFAQNAKAAQRFGANGSARSVVCERRLTMISASAQQYEGSRFNPGMEQKFFSQCQVWFRLTLSVPSPAHKSCFTASTS